MKIERYTTYKASEVEWLSEIPKKWKVKRIKDVSGIRYGLSQPPKYLEEGLPLIRATNIEKGKLVEKGLVFINPDDVPYGRNPILNENDIVVVRSGAYTADSAIIPKKYHGAIAGFDMVLRPHKIHAKYFSYTLLSNYLLKDQLILSSFRAAQPHLNKEELGTALIVYPSLSEQKAIAHYLDTKTGQIDRKIDLLTQKAALYGDLKQSLINETVTRGLDKSVLMKDSESEILGKIPEHWNINKLSQSFGQIGSGTTPKSGNEVYYEDGSINWINTGDLNDGILNECKRKVTPQALIDHSLNIYPVGAIVIAMYGATIGKVSILNINGCTNQACCVLNKSKTLDIKFLFYWFISRRNFIISLSYGGGQPNISQDTIKSLRVCAPPISEQKALADYLDTKTAQIDQIIHIINTQIEKLKELRKTLINDVVTGKIKVV
ncbi:restriction endonuclease subunit S [Microcoleus sp. OTE_8_concoct_300]|uniref:restriction endonuclease subunit S n=1 Tax=Microcoleus sp. OTE_8_concoct_300 TaxID=2964710 RepID=UPI00403FB0A5